MTQPEKRLLYVDDDLVLRTLITQIAGMQGFTVETRSNMEEGLEYIEDPAKLSKLRVLMIDGQIPGVRGHLTNRLIARIGGQQGYYDGHVLIYAAKEVKATHQLAQPRIVGYSAHNLGYDRNHVAVPEQFAPDEVLIKPSSFTDLGDFFRRL